jgi:hypothetical protein
MSANNANIPLSKRDSTINGDDRSDSESYDESDDQSYDVKHESNMKDR